MFFTTLQTPLFHRLSCKMQQSYNHLLCLPWRYKPPSTYRLSVKTLQKFTGCLSQCYKLSLSPAVKYKPSHSFVGWANRSVSHSSTNVCWHSDLMAASLNYRQTAAETQKSDALATLGRRLVLMSCQDLYTAISDRYGLHAALWSLRELYRGKTIYIYINIFFR